MKYLYKEGLPFQYQYMRNGRNDKERLSDELKSEFNCCYKKIACCNKDFSYIKTKLKSEFDRLKSAVKLELANKDIYKKIYVTDYLDFLFGVCYLLFKKYNISQEEAADLIGIKKNQFSKLDIYPRRCYDAFIKSDERGLSPDGYDWEGVAIAKFVNKMQAPYACYGFVGVSNDLDIFVNTFSTDKKAYILTQPAISCYSEYSKEQIIDIMEKFAYSKARFLFASGNNFDSKNGVYMSGKIKEEIIKILRMEANWVCLDSPRIKKMLQEGEEYKKYVQGNRALFERSLGYYRNQLSFHKELEMEPMSMYLYMDEEEWRKIGIDYEDIEDVLEEDGGKALQTKIEGSINKLYDKLRGSMSYYDEHEVLDLEAFEDWLEILKALIRNRFSCKILDGQNGKDEDKIRAAAVYWVLHMFSHLGVSQKSYNSIISYLKTDKLLTYLDCLNKEIQKKSNRTHLYFESDDFNINKTIEELIDGFGKSFRPLLVYIDMEAYTADKHIESIGKNKKIMLIVRDKSGEIKRYGLYKLNDELGLYGGGIINAKSI